MKNELRCMAALALCSTSYAWASGVVRIADGDCAALATASASPAGKEPSLIILARNGHYVGCMLEMTGTIVIDGAGANLPAEQMDSQGNFTGFGIHVAQGGSLTLRNLNMIGTTQTSSSDPKSASIRVQGPKPSIAIGSDPKIFVEGNLVLDSVSIAFNTTDIIPTPEGGVFVEGGGLFYGGNITLRNVTITANIGQEGYIPLFAGTPIVTISHSTIANNQNIVFNAGNISIGNSIITGNTHTCSSGVHLTSLGGNVTDDASCGLAGTNDRVVSNASLLELDTHGGVVKNVALRNDSPAIGNAVVSNCEATDSRGFSRGQTACDSGAYEFGGDSGQISKTGMSGLFYNPANDGHYVTIQRLHDDTALVIWNTFDENGVPAWLYGVGAVSGQSIHVGQVGRNSGGKLLPGGDVVGSHAALWGTIDVSLSDCYNAKLNYNSTDPNFGSGSTPLTRLAFLDGVNCAP